MARRWVVVAAANAHALGENPRHARTGCGGYFGSVGS